MNKIKKAAFKFAFDRHPRWFGPQSGILKRNIAQVLRRSHVKNDVEVFILGALWALSNPQKSPISEHEILSTYAQRATVLEEK